MGTGVQFSGEEVVQGESAIGNFRQRESVIRADGVPHVDREFTAENRGIASVAVARLFVAYVQLEEAESSGGIEIRNRDI